MRLAAGTTSSNAASPAEAATMARMRAGCSIRHAARHSMLREMAWFSMGTVSTSAIKNLNMMNCTNPKKEDTSTHGLSLSSNMDGSTLPTAAATKEPRDTMEMMANLFTWYCFVMGTKCFWKNRRNAEEERGSVATASPHHSPRDSGNTAASTHRKVMRSMNPLCQKPENLASSTWSAILNVINPTTACMPAQERQNPCALGPQSPPPVCMSMPTAICP
mmetsp:Transcript_71117/g.133977  ORF Transcript_71117/g.133977 Transcript_71117/m.133977 type:complete len:219 (+) Transcript_71117:1033-1689(+)